MGGEMHQAAAVPQGSPQECYPAQRPAAGTAQAKRAELAQKTRHNVHTCMRSQKPPQTCLCSSSMLLLQPLLFAMAALAFID